MPNVNAKRPNKVTKDADFRLVFFQKENGDRVTRVNGSTRVTIFGESIRVM